VRLTELGVFAAVLRSSEGADMRRGRRHRLTAIQPNSVVDCFGAATMRARTTGRP